MVDGLRSDYSMGFYQFYFQSSKLIYETQGYDIVIHFTVIFSHLCLFDK